MEVKILEEAGFNSALYGFSLSYKDRAIKRDDWWMFCFSDCDEPNCLACAVYTDRREVVKRINQTTKTATANAGRGMGHDKWLRQVQLWIDIEMCRAWWPELDQYKIATVTSSESTVHTLMRRPITLKDCEEGTTQAVVDAYNAGYPYADLHKAKMNLPEGYLQRRVLTCNYATLRNIIDQRTGHKMPEWSYFIKQIYLQCEHKELLP